MEYIIVLGVLIAAFSALFLVAAIKKDNSIVDVFWGVGFIVAAFFSYMAYGDGLWYQLAATGLVLIWGLRLSGRILKRNWGKGEDWRYRKWRDEWQYFYARSFFQIFLLQAVLCFIVALPVIAINLTSIDEPRMWLMLVGVAVWLIGFLFEAVGDWQLDRFMSREDRKKNEVLMSGLWRYTRHPNYFGEVSQWWGIGLIALGVDFSLWWTAVGALTITVLLLKVSGVPMLEGKMQKNPEFRKYMQQTNKFIPGPTRDI